MSDQTQAWSDVGNGRGTPKNATDAYKLARKQAEQKANS